MMTRNLRIPNKLWWISVVAGVLLAAGCDSNETLTDPMDAPVDTPMNAPMAETVDDVVTSLTSTTNPTGYAPLTAEIYLTTSRPVQVELFIPGQSTEAGDVRHRFEETGESFTLPVLGLYPAITNTVSLRLFEPNGALLEEVSHDIIVSPLLPALPRIAVNRSILNRMKPGMNLVSYSGTAGENQPQLPFMFDAEGTIRWYIDFAGHPSLSRLLYDTGPERLANGNLYFGDRTTDRIIEIDMLGRVLNEWPLPGYGFHHNVIEMPNGNFLATVTKNGLGTVQDHILEIDRVTGNLLQVWDLNQALDNQRRTWARNNRDWFHSNGIVYDETDDTIIVSGRTQGTVKLTRNNEIVWLLAPHRDWMTAGNGADLNRYLLQPLDASGQPITDPEILDGSTNHPDFEWAWYQHAPELMPDGTLLLFDNGEDHRNFMRGERYSRAVQFRIDASVMTVQQVWQYGKERGEETFSSIVSDVDYHQEEDNIVFMPGASHFGGEAYGKTIEIDYSTCEVVFEATITPPMDFRRITFHRVERLPLYSPN